MTPRLQQSHALVYPVEPLSDWFKTCTAIARGGVYHRGYRDNVRTQPRMRGFATVRMFRGG